MEVVIRLHGDLCAKAGTSTIKLPIDENETIDTLLMKLGRRHSDLLEAILDPQTGELRSHCNILLNGRRVQQLRGIHTKLKHKDEIAIFPPESGG